MASAVEPFSFDFDAFFKSNPNLEKRQVFVGEDSTIPASIEVNFTDRNQIFYNLKSNKDEWGILTLSVSPDEVFVNYILNLTRKTANKVDGVGNALMDHAFLLSEATEKELTLDSEPEVIGFYEKYGFVPIERPAPPVADDNESPMPAYIMLLRPQARETHRKRLSVCQ